MSYKKDMLLILTVILILGTAIQTARTDLITMLAAGEKQVGIDRNIKAKHPIFQDLLNSMKEQ